MAAQDQVSEAHGASGVAQEDPFGSFRMPEPLPKAERAPEPTSGYLDMSAQIRGAELAQATEGATYSKNDREMMSSDQQIQGSATFLNSNTYRPRGEASLRPEDRQLNDRTAEMIRQRFEEELITGGNPEAMQRRMNELLAPQGLAVRYSAHIAEAGRPGRFSQLEVVDTRRTVPDRNGTPTHPTIGNAYDVGMPMRRRA